MTLIRSMLAAAVALCFAFAASERGFAADFTLKLATVSQPSNPLTAGLQMFAKQVAEKSGGRIEVVIYHSAQLGGERDYVEGMQLGSVEMAITSTPVLTAWEPKLGIFSLPFLIRSGDQFDKVVDGPIGQDLASKFLGFKVRLLGWFDWGPRVMHNSKRPIMTPADTKGLKFRTVQDPIYVATYEALGASAVPMARPEVYSALKQGVIDGTDTDMTNYEDQGDYEVAKYSTVNVELFQTVGPLMISEAVFSKLPADLQKVLVDAAHDVAPKQRAAIRGAEEAATERLQKKGVVVSKADAKPFADATSKIWDKFASQVGGKGAIDAVANAGR
jgi:tripartite ATP-independent transporter DctP family solute receptor